MLRDCPYSIIASLFDHTISTLAINHLELTHFAELLTVEGVEVVITLNVNHFCV